MNTKQTTKGFTIIEVVLVLAIAGLILLMALVAWPALQSSQRDTARKNDVSATASAVSTYVSNNRGKFPDPIKLKNYVTNTSDNTSVFKLIENFGEGEVEVSDGEVFVATGVKCGEQADTGEKASYAVEKGTGRQFVTVTWLETGGGTAFCQDS